MVTGSKVRVPDDDGTVPPPPPAVEDMPPLDIPPSDILLDEPVVDVEPALPAAGEDVPPLPIPGEDAASAGGVRRSTRSRGGTGGGGDAPPPPPAAAAEGAPPPHGHHVLQESYDQKWDAKYDELVAYHAEKGNANVPQSLGLLGRWVGRQREFYKKNALSVDRVARLERLGIHWAPKKDLPSWDERYEELKEYKKTHGNTNVPTSGLGLGSWVRVQRTCMKKNKLAQDKVDRLNEIGFKFRPGVTPKLFDERFAEVEEYKRKFGDANVPTSYTTLGRWVAGIRMKKNKLRPEQIERFDAIGFLWKPGRGKVNNRNIGRGKRRKPTTEVINVNTIVSDDVKAKAEESDVSLRVLAATSLMVQSNAAPGADGKDDEDEEEDVQGMEGVEMADADEMMPPLQAPPGLGGLKTEGLEDEEDATAGLKTEEISLQANV